MTTIGRRQFRHEGALPSLARATLVAGTGSAIGVDHVGLGIGMDGTCRPVLE